MTSNMGTTGANAELIVEAVVENLGLKQKLFADLEAASSALPSAFFAVHNRMNIKVPSVWDEVAFQECIHLTSYSLLTGSLTVSIP